MLASGVVYAIALATLLNACAVDIQCGRVAVPRIEDRVSSTDPYFVLRCGMFCIL